MRTVGQKLLGNGYCNRRFLQSIATLHLLVVDGLELWIAVEDDRLVGTRSVRRALAGENLFVTGGAGTGKTETLKRIFRSLRAVHRQQRESAVWLTAMSGPAAWRLGGITLASFVAGRGSCDGGSRR